MNRKLLVISIDSFITEDLEIMKTLPNFNRVLKNASLVKKNLTTYPSLTHSVHTTIQTGCYPGTHGVINNEHFQPYVKAPAWFDDASDIQVPTFSQEIAAQTGATVALVFWPLIRGAHADWVITRPGCGGPHGDYKDAEDELIKTSTPGIFTGSLYERCHGVMDSLPHYYNWDEFSARACEQMIHLHQPDVMITHWTVIDAERHHNGVFNDVLPEAYAALDRGLGYILKALEEEGLLEKTCLCITSDHGHMNIDRGCNPNVLMAEHGLLEVTDTGDLKDYQVFCHGAGLSCQVYLKDKSPENTEKVKKFFLEHQEELCFSELIMPDALWERYHLKGDFSFMMESDGHTGYSSEWTGAVISKAGEKDYRQGKSTHGHSPEKSVQPCLIVSNPFRKEKVIVENGRVIDQAPTFAAMMGATMPKAEGKVMEELV